MNNGSTYLSDMRRNKVVNTITSVVSVLALQYATIQAAYAGDAKPKAKAPLEERLDKVPKMAPPVLEPYEPKTPGPFSVVDVDANPKTVEGSYDEKTRTFDGTIKIYGQEADISLLVGPKESDEHALSVKFGDKPLQSLTINKSGQSLFMDWDKNVGAFAYSIDGQDFIIGFSYMDRDDKKKIGEIKTIDLVYQVFLLTDADRVPKSVREKGAKGNLLLYVSREDGEAITCNFVNDDMIGSSSRPDPAVYCREVVFERDYSKLIAQQTDDVKVFASEVKSEVQKMLKSGAQKDSILGYVELMTSEVKRRLELDTLLFDKQNPNSDYIVPLVVLPKEAAVKLLEDKLVQYVEENYITTIHEEPAPLPDSKLPVVADVQNTEDDKLRIVPLVPVPVKELPPVKEVPVKAVPVKEVPVKEEPKSLDVKIAEIPIHPAFDFTPKVEPKKEDTAGEDDFWTSSLAIGLYVAAGVLVAGAVGTGVYFGTRDNGGGTDPQPPVGNPTMGPGDKW